MKRWHICGLKKIMTFLACSRYTVLLNRWEFPKNRAMRPWDGKLSTIVLAADSLYGFV
jgi:hypothetical protein